MISRPVNFVSPSTHASPDVNEATLAGDFRALANYIPHIVWTARPGGEIEYLNQRGQDYLGMTVGDIVRTGFDQLIYPEDLYAAKRGWNDSRERLANYESQYRLRRYDGIYRWHVTRAHPVLNESGGIARWFGTCTDVHDARFAADMLAESEDQFRATFGMAATGIAHFNVEGRCIRANDSLCLILGYARERLLKMSYHGIVHPDDLAGSHEVQRQLLSGIATHSQQEHRVVRGDGSILWVRANIAVIKRRGTPNFIMVEVRDISARKRLEAEIMGMRIDFDRQLQECTAQLAQAHALIENAALDRQRAEAEARASRAQMIHSARMSALGQMAGGLAHEVQGPLSHMHASADDLRDAAATGRMCPSRIRRTASEIISTVERLEHAASALSTFARENTRVAAEWASLREIIEKTLAFCRHRLSQAGISLRIDVPDGLQAYCRPVQISQVLLHLLTNAHDAVHGLPSPWIKIHAWRGDGRLHLSVTDSGPGIAPELADKIMLPFFTTKDVDKGSGLGLSISRDIVENHGGQLVIDAACPNTRFVIVLPEPQRGPYEEKP